MATTIVRHKVNDYAVWRKAFDEFDANRKAGGEQSFSVLQVDGDPNDVIVINTWESMDAAKAFFGQEELKEAMQKAGVAGPPEFVYANET